MIATPITEQIPIRIDEHGRLRVGNTRVLLDLVIYSFRLGHTPETITSQYPSLSLDDVYLQYLRQFPKDYNGQRNEYFPAVLYCQ